MRVRERVSGWQGRSRHCLTLQLLLHPCRPADFAPHPLPTLLPSRSLRQVSSISALVRELVAGMEMLREELRELGSSGAAAGGKEAAPPLLGDGEAESKMQGGGGDVEEEDGGDLGEAAANRFYARRVSSFVALHEAACEQLPALEEGLTEELRALCAYFDEAFDPKEPTR